MKAPLLAGAPAYSGAGLERTFEPVSSRRTFEEAVEQIGALMGRTHSLFSAAVVAQWGRPVWRHVSEAKLTMGLLSEAWVRGYVERNWEAIRHSVGGYRIEEEGVRLMARVDGDHFCILGMPLLPLLGWLAVRGEIAS